MGPKAKTQHVVPPDEYEGRHAVGYRFDDGTSVWIRYEPDGRFLEVGPDLVPERFEARVNDPALPFVVFLTFEERARRPALELLSVARRREDDALPITTEGLREVAVNRLVTVAMIGAAHSKDRPAGEQPEIRSLTDFAESYRRQGFERSRDGRLGDEHYRGVAAVYRSALERGDRRPTQAVRTAFSTSSSTASRWVLEARRRGQLGPAPKQGSAGERITPALRRRT